MPDSEPNPNKIDRQHTEDSPPPADHGERMSPDDDADAIALGHEEAEKQRTGNGVPATQGTGAGGGKSTPPRTG